MPPHTLSTLHGPIYFDIIIAPLNAPNKHTYSLSLPDTLLLHCKQMRAYLHNPAFPMRTCKPCAGLDAPSLRIHEPTYPVPQPCPPSRVWGAPVVVGKAAFVGIIVKLAGFRLGHITGRGPRVGARVWAWRGASGAPRGVAAGRQGLEGGRRGFRALALSRKDHAQINVTDRGLSSQYVRSRLARTNQLPCLSAQSTKPGRLQPASPAQ